MKCAGLIFSESFHFIDHLAPFCSLMGWPLIVLEGSVAEQCRSYYPDLEVIEKAPLPPCVVTCDNRALLEAAFWPHWTSKILWLPHGLSDKGWKGPFFEALEKEDLLLVYGQKMRDVLAAKNVKIPQFTIGNFRLEYFKKHREFYAALLQQRFGEERFVLYAPTWEDSENNGTFWEAFPPLAAAIPRNRQLLVKAHPNTEQKFVHRLERCKGMAPHVQFLEQFPPIYPILERTDVYIGDMSSIGYDFLPFQRPMVFLQREKTDPAKDPSALLMQAGTQITIEEIPELFSRLQTPVQPGLQEYAFDSVPGWPEKLQTVVDQWLAC
ncbi:MAG TPA: CDP-glycerol glycerophosphotransferase family protein [Chlamydiales bacterium]|nr:CDP-glycerol glycerophosphotransferase family protein [Chlamydiales bacterium]